MLLEELKEAFKNGTFILGHKLKVKPFEVFDTDGMMNWEVENTLKRAGNSFNTFEMLNYDSIVLIDNEDKNFTMKLDMLDFVEDERSPSDKSLAIVSELINSEKMFMCGTAGERHGSSNSSVLTNETVYPVITPSETKIQKDEIKG